MINIILVDPFIARNIPLEDNISIRDVLEDNEEDYCFEKFAILHNGNVVKKDDIILNDGDRLIFIPKKVT